MCIELAENTKLKSDLHPKSTDDFPSYWMFTSGTIYRPLADNR